MEDDLCNKKNGRTKPQRAAERNHRCVSGRNKIHLNKYVNKSAREPEKSIFKQFQHELRQRKELLLTPSIAQGVCTRAQRGGEGLTGVVTISDSKLIIDTVMGGLISCHITKVRKELNLKMKHKI